MALDFGLHKQVYLGPARTVAVASFIGPALGGILIAMISIKELFSSLAIGRSVFSVLLLVAALFFFSTALSAAQAAKAGQKLTFIPSGVSVSAESARTPAERSKGLMYRTSMGELEAMLFSFEESTRLTFWMYHTRIPLTIIFLDEAFRIVDMQNMAPCLGEDSGACPIYTSRLNARHAIEVNQGFVEKYHIMLGDHVRIGKGR
jgi:uncharacterized membrane protein (UPF0127 family)